MLICASADGTTKWFAVQQKLLRFEEVSLDLDRNPDT